MFQIYTDVPHFQSVGHLELQSFCNLSFRTKSGIQLKGMFYYWISRNARNDEMPSSLSSSPLPFRRGAGGEVLISPDVPHFQSVAHLEILHKNIRCFIFNQATFDVVSHIFKIRNQIRKIADIIRGQTNYRKIR